MNFDLRDYSAKGLRLFILRITNPFYRLKEYIEYKIWLQTYKKKRKEWEKRKFQRMLKRELSDLRLFSFMVSTAYEGPGGDLEWNKKYYDFD